MKADIDKDGYLRIDASSLVEAMPDDVIRTLSKYAVFQEKLLSGVVDALLDDHMWSDDEEGPWWHGGDTINKLRMRLLTRMPEITQKAAQHLEHELRNAKIEARTWREACWALERDWPEGRREVKPWEQYERKLTKEEAGAYLREVEKKLGEAKEPSGG